MLSLGTCAQAEEARDAGCSTPPSLSVNSQISALQQRLKDSEALRDELNQQLQTVNNNRESAQSSRLHQDNQRLRQQLEHASSTTAPSNNGLSSAPQ
jgi:septal ring factor EnvC (AmiA/AmiB activator)